jgi:alpha-methylacyl-CoA racemase
MLELARVPPAELPGMLLADAGAEVLKIQGPGELSSEEEKRRAAFSAVNRNKRSLTLDLKTPDGQQILHRLAANADVLVEGFRPGVTKRLGADYDSIRAVNPRIVYCSLSGFGQDGPYRDLPGHDVSYLSLAGILNLIGEADRAPQIPLNLIADYGGASLHGALGIMMALFARERTGLGQYVDVSYFETSLALLGATPLMQLFRSDGLVPRRGAGVLSGTYPYYAVYETADARFVSIACLEAPFWERFCQVIGRPDLTRLGLRPDDFVREANAEQRQARIEVQRVIGTRTWDEWWDVLSSAGIPVGKVRGPEELSADPHVRARDMIVTVNHPQHGPIPQFGVPIRLSGTPGRVRTAAPSAGEHTDEVLGALGLTPAEIRDLRTRRVVA